MRKEKINPFEYAGHILTSLNNGILMTTISRERVNTMTIAWGMLGIEWGMPIFTVFVRTHRYTHECLDEFPEFTINVPIGNYDKRVLSVAGTKSGRDLDKIAALGLHPVKSEKISAPGLLEFPLTLECRVIYRQRQDKNAVPPELRAAYHPEGNDPYTSVLNGDYHTAYYGAIVDAYIIRA